MARAHKLGMALIAFIALAGATALQPPAAPVRTSSASLSVGATVIRPDLPPQVSVSEGKAVVSNPGRAAVSAEGGTVRRSAGGALVVTPSGAGPVFLTFTY